MSNWWSACWSRTTTYGRSRMTTSAVVRGASRASASRSTRQSLYRARQTPPLHRIHRFHGMGRRAPAGNLVTRVETLVAVMQTTTDRGKQVEERPENSRTGSYGPKGWQGMAGD